MEALKRCLRWIAPDAHNLDPHLKPQIDFFLHEGRVLPQLAYVGHVEELQHDWPALVSAFFGPKPGAQVHQILEHDRLHVRSKGSERYYDSEALAALDAKFSLAHMSESVREIIAEAFRVDEARAVIRAQRPPNPSPNSNPNPSLPLPLNPGELRALLTLALALSLTLTEP